MSRDLSYELRTANLRRLYSAQRGIRNPVASDIPELIIGKQLECVCPVRTTSGIPTLSQVLGSGNDGGAFDMFNLGLISADAFNVRLGTIDERLTFDDGTVPPLFFYTNETEHLLTSAGATTSAKLLTLDSGYGITGTGLVLGKIVLQGNGPSTCTLTTAGNSLLVNGDPVGTTGGGNLFQVLSNGNNAAGLGMTGISYVSAASVIVGGNPAYNKAYYPGVGVTGEDAEQRVIATPPSGDYYDISADRAALFADFTAYPGRIYFITSAQGATTLDLGSLGTADRTVLNLLINWETDPLYFRLKTTPANYLLCQPGESVRLVYSTTYAGWRYIGM